LSKLGGNCRLRLPNKLIGRGLKKGVQPNSNPFFKTEKTALALISTSAPLHKVVFPQTECYDFITMPGKIYTFYADK